MTFARHILVPTDFSQASELALEAAAVLARQIGAKVSLVHVYDPTALPAPATLGWDAAQQRSVEAEVHASIEKSFAELETKRLAGVEVAERTVLRDPSPSQAICEYAEKVGADLIVIATHGRTGLKHLLIGSVTERVVRHASCPVLTLRSTAAD
jgi:nucleotide-binding universal stress UspA family protein